eukprot:4250552-Pleurochrysis_carterae.AAC.1
MPVRNNDGVRAEAIWERVMEDITDRGNRNFVINSDFNAETEAWIKNNGRTQLEEDVIYQGAIEDLNLIATHTATGVREKDHRVVVARLAWKVKVVKGEGRPTCGYTDIFQEEQWQRYEQILTERIQEITKSLKVKRPRNRLQQLQETLTRAAAEAGGEKVKERNSNGEREEGYNRREEKELNKEEQRRERQRHQLLYGTGTCITRNGTQEGRKKRRVLEKETEQLDKTTY